LGISLRIFLFLAAVLFGLSPTSGLADSLRCDGKLVTVGDSKLDAVAKCGNPVLKETREEERAIRVFDSRRKVFREVRKTVVIDEWTYNFGPGQFLYLVRFRDGKVSEIERGGYGYTAEELKREEAYPDSRPCKGRSFFIGDTKVDVVAKCGEPAVKESRQETRVTEVFDKGNKSSREFRQTGTVDQWTYNFGPSRLLYFLRFENGKLVEIETGGYGYTGE
jgi:hypothetical protein